MSGDESLLDQSMIFTENVPNDQSIDLGNILTQSSNLVDTSLISGPSSLTLNNKNEIMKEEEIRK
jgi:hypothetical protein